MRHFLVDDDSVPPSNSRSWTSPTHLKAEPYRLRPFAGPRTVAVLFDKPSTRTRVSFETAIAELGGNPMIMDAAASQLGRGESISDTARVLGRHVAAIVWRTSGQERLEEMAAYAGRAGDQRADRPVPPLPGAGRPADHPGAQGRTGRADAWPMSGMVRTTWRIRTCWAAAWQACTFGSALQPGFQPDP